MGKPRGSYTHYNLTYNEDIIPEHQKLSVFERDGHFIIGHPDMICDCRECGKQKNQTEFSVENKPDKYGRKKIKSICRECNSRHSNLVYHLKNKYGPAPDKCQICLEPLTTGKQINIDHNHITGEFRGWLCPEHNTGLGRFRDDPFEMMRGIKYLVLNDKMFDRETVITKLQMLIEDIKNDKME